MALLKKAAAAAETNTENTVTAEEESSRFHNPFLKRVESESAKVQINTRASYRGVFCKIIYFLIMTAIGFAAFFAVKQMAANMNLVNIVDADYANGVMHLTMTSLELHIFFTTEIISVICLLAAVFVRALVPVLGTAYMLGEGYALAFFTGSLSVEYRWLGITAMLLTMALVGVMYFLYSHGIVSVTGKVRRVVYITFFTLFIGGVLLFFMSFIPGMATFVEAVHKLVENPVIGLALAIFFVVFSCMMLVGDFDAIHEVVENGMDKSYEWSCAFGIAYTVVYLYLRVLGLLIRLVGKKN